MTIKIEDQIATLKALISQVSVIGRMPIAVGIDVAKIEAAIETLKGCGWIPVSESTPKHGQLIAIKWGEDSPKDYDCFVYSKIEGVDWSIAVSWMPLPTP